MLVKPVLTTLYTFSSLICNNAKYVLIWSSFIFKILFPEIVLKYNTWINVLSTAEGRVRIQVWILFAVSLWIVITGLNRLLPVCLISSQGAPDLQSRTEKESKSTRVTASPCLCLWFYSWGLFCSSRSSFGSPGPNISLQVLDPSLSLEMCCSSIWRTHLQIWGG